MPHVLVDARVCARGHTGIARYVRELVPRLARRPDLTVGAIVDAARPEPLGTYGPIHARAPFLSLAEQFELPLRVAAARLRRRDLLTWIPAYDVPAALPGPFVATIHDANHLAFPEQYSRAHALYYATVVRAAVVRARALLVPSRFARDELVSRLGADPARVHVTPLAAAVPARPSEERIAEARRALALPARYVAYLGNFKPHKNLPMLLAAARAFARECPLVLVGGSEAELGGGLGRARAEGLDVRVVRALDDDALWPFLAGAAAFAFPSRYEGFGLPPLEAMALGVPVVTTNAGSLPEVAGDAAPCLDPDDDEGFGRAVARLLSDPAHAAEASARALAQAARFSWERTADETARVLLAAAA